MNTLVIHWKNCTLDAISNTTADSTSAPALTAPDSLHHLRCTLNVPTLRAAILTQDKWQSTYFNDSAKGCDWSLYKLMTDGIESSIMIKTK